MPEFIDPFFAPIRDSQPAQVGTVALLVLTLADILFGVANAMFFQQDFSSHELRRGLFRKLGNFGMLLVADILDALLLGGLDLGFQPIYIATVSAFVLMEVASIFELWGAVHPEFQDTPIWAFFANAKGKGKTITTEVSDYGAPEQD